jgi:hypothetical protein
VHQPRCPSFALSFQIPGHERDVKPRFYPKHSTCCGFRNSPENEPRGALANCVSRPPRALRRHRQGSLSEMAATTAAQVAVRLHSL